MHGVPLLDLEAAARLSIYMGLKTECIQVAKETFCYDKNPN